MNSRQKAKSLPKRFGWREQLKKERRRQWSVIFRSGLILVSLLLAATLLVEIWQGWRRSQWDERRTFYLAIQSGETGWLVKVDKLQGQIVIGKIPGDMMVEAAYGFGEYQAKNLYKLGEQEEIGGAVLFKDSLTWTFGLPVKGVLRFSQSADKLPLSRVLAKSLLGFGETNLTWWDKLRLWWFVSSLRQDRIERFSFEEVPGSNKAARPDGIAVWEFNQDRLDRWLGQRFTSLELVNEPLTWEVVNASGHPGLALKVGRLLRNTGLQVVQVVEKDLDQEAIFVDQGVNSSAVNFMSEFLKLPVIEEKPGGYHSDVVVVIGEEFIRRCCQLK